MGNRIQLNNGLLIPQLGYGTYGVDQGKERR